MHLTTPIASVPPSYLLTKDTMSMDQIDYLGDSVFNMKKSKNSLSQSVAVISKPYKKLNCKMM